jgi:glycine betaine/proline transport system substrate-binding protein
MLCFSGLAGAEQALPGQGKNIQPMTTGRSDQYFQNFVVQIGLERLGYTVLPYLEAQYPAMHLAIAQGDADYAAVHWQPLHDDYFKSAGGDASLVRLGSLIDGAIQGYLIDKKTADAYGIKTIDQLKDPKIAQLFDSDGDGKANLTGCNPGWGCEKVIEHHLDAYGLRNTVSHDQGEYFALMADTIARYREGKPILYYTWTPLWVSSVLKPDQDSVFLDVPFSSLPDIGDKADTKLANGRNTGFGLNNIRIIANKNFIAENPAAQRFMELVHIPIDDVNAEILKVHEGQDSLEDTRRHAQEWVDAHEAEFSDWVHQAVQVAKN